MRKTAERLHFWTDSNPGSVFRAALEVLYGRSCAGYYSLLTFLKRAARGSPSIAFSPPLYATDKDHVPRLLVIASQRLGAHRRQGRGCWSSGV
jgi:hypothetical protein